MRRIQQILRKVFGSVCVGLGLLVLASGAAALQSPGRIVWVSWGGNGTTERWFTVIGDGSGYRELKGGLPISFAFSPEASRVASAQLGDSGASSVVIDAFDGSRSRVVTRLGGHESFGLGRSIIDWSGDGQRLSYSTGTGLWTVGVDGSTKRRIVQQRGITSVSWSPTGTEIAFVRTFEHTGSPWQRDIYVVRSDGTALHRIAITYGFTDVTWSPDGRRILFSSFRSSKHAYKGPNATMYAIDVKTHARVSLGPGNNPSYSPDGRRIAFILRRSAGSFGQAATSTSGGKARRVLATKWLSGPVWSPDGSELVGSGYTRDGLVAVSADGVRHRKVAPLDGEVKELDWGG